jgi:predicted transposase YdaD
MVFDTIKPVALINNENNNPITYPLFPKTTLITFNSGNIVSSSRIKRLAQSHHDSEINESIYSTITSLLPTINTNDSNLKVGFCCVEKVD